MTSFPQLKTTAVAQYPLARRTTYSTEILQFTDGSEQRYSNYAQPVRRWQIQLASLDEGELSALRQFFRAQNGLTGRFTFIDPVSATAYPNCSFDQQMMSGTLQDVSRSSASLVIRTN